MAKVLKLSGMTGPALRRAKGRRNTKALILEELGQLSLFAGLPGRIVDFPANLSLLERAHLAEDRGNIEEARELYWQSISLGNEVADAYCNLGVLEFHAGRKTKAVSCYLNSLKHEPGHFESRYNLAVAYLRARELDLARLHYEICVDLVPDSPEPHLQLGVVCTMQGDLTKAVEELLRYKELAPGKEGKKVDCLLECVKLELGM